MITIAGRRYKRKRLIWLIVALLAAVLLAGVILAGNGEAPLPEPAPIILHNGRIVGNRIISKSWTMEYKSIVTSADGVTVDVVDIHSGLFYKDGKPYISFHAAHAVGNTATLSLNLTGNVHLETLSGSVKRSFDTDYVTWNNAAQSLDLPHPITLRSDAAILHVSSISVNFASGKTTIKGIRGDVH